MYENSISWYNSTIPTKQALEFIMNMYTKQIAALLKISLDQALAVQSQMDINGVDFSECSTRTFNKEAKIAAQEIGM
jgi:hypothetical protein